MTDDLEVLVRSAAKQIRESDWLSQNPATGPRIFSLPENLDVNASPKQTEAKSTDSVSLNPGSTSSSHENNDGATSSVTVLDPSLEDLLDQLGGLVTK
mmetsp:Transcript_20369/g.35030  ORF Transcript_20369/g.35030 Transcript_20369/m.35030 type:complete len:98 (+) Transcript_20369:45-338(+)